MVETPPLERIRLAPAGEPRRVVPAGGLNFTAVAGFATTAGLDPSSYTATAAAGILTIKVIGASDPVTCSVTYTQAADATTPPVISALSLSGC